MAHDPATTRVIFSKHVVTPAGVRPGAVEVVDGRIVAVHDAAPAGRFEDLGDAWLLPGLVDTHVHVNEPGRGEWEGFASATRAALAGGITTLVDMPLNSVPATTTAAALAAKRAAAAGRVHADVAFWGGVVPGNAAGLEPLAAAGVCGFKSFLVPSGVDEFPGVDARDLEQAMPVIARLGLPLLVHAELPGPLEAARAAWEGRDPRRYATWLASRPPAAEVEAVELMVALARRHGCRVHIVHVAAGEAVEALRAARADGVAVTAETCPHYLTFAADEIPDGATEFKCAPPIRGRDERERLWEALRAGVLDLIASDHSPCPPAMKRAADGDFMAAWGGIASLEAAFGAVWSGARARGFAVEDVARWMAAAPARLAGLDARKGAIAPGRDADLIAWDPDAEWTLDRAALRQRHAVTPYHGRTLRGRVLAVWLRGACVHRAGPHADADPRGELLRP